MPYITEILSQDVLYKLIQSEALIEGYQCSLKDVDNIVNAKSISNFEPNKIICIKNLFNAWNAMNTDKQISTEYLCLYNSIIEANMNDNAGKIRTSVVSVSLNNGEKYFPPIPSMSTINQELYNIAQIEDPIEQALTALLIVAKGQFFNDGNKRTAQIVANHILTYYHTNKIFLVSLDKVEKFKQILVEFYSDKIAINIAVKKMFEFVVDAKTN